MDAALTSLLYRGRLINDAEVALLFADHPVRTQCPQMSIKSGVDARWIYGKNCASFFTQFGNVLL